MTWTRPTWLRHLSMAHYPISAAELSQLVPAPLRLETRPLPNGQPVGYFSVVLLEDALVGLPTPCPRVGRYVQVNLRTYVTYGERRGVYFFSSWVSSAPVAHLVHRGLGIPFEQARLRLRVSRPGHGRPHRLLYEGVLPISLKLELSGIPTATAPALVPGFASAAEAADVLGHPQWGFFRRNGNLYAYSVYHPAFDPWTLAAAQTDFPTAEQLIARLQATECPPTDQSAQKRADPDTASAALPGNAVYQIGSCHPTSIFYVPELYFAVRLPPQPLPPSPP